MKGYTMRGIGAASINSSFDAVSSLAGDMVWECATSIDNPQPPSFLGLQGQRLLVSYGGYLDVRDRETGKGLLTSSIGAGLLLVDEKGCMFVNGGDRLIRLLWDGATVDKGKAPFAGMGMLALLDEAGDELRYCYALPPQPVTNPDDPTVGPQFSYVRYAMAEDDLRWEYTRQGVVRSVFPLAQPSGFCVIADKCVYIIKAAGNGDKDVALYSCNEAFCGSAGAQGFLYIVIDETIKAGKESRRIVSLACFDAAFKAQWRYALPAQPRVAQAPAVLDNGEAYLLTGGTVQKVANGKSLWSHDLPCAWDKAALTVLKNTSILVVAGQALIHFAADGTELKRMFFPEPLTGCPVADEKGRVFVAGTRTIYCVK